MDLIDWRFSNSNTLGTHIASVGFNMQADGPGITVENRVAVSSITPDPPAALYERDCAANRPATQYGLIVAHVVADMDAPVTLPDDAVVSYGGLTMALMAFATDASEFDDRLHLLAYLWIGDGADLSDDLFSVEFFGIAEARFGVEILYVEGVAQSSPAFRQAGVVDTFTSPLTLDPGPDPVEWDFVITAAAQGLVDLGQSTLTIATAKYLANDAIRSTAAVGRTAIYLCDTSFNCDCETDPEARTLLDMRRELLVRAGYASQADNPPPGVAELFNSYLQSGQRDLYHRFKPLQTKRFFSWPLVAGRRYYALPDHLQCCAAALNRNQIDGAWVQDPNNTWWPLSYGIDPTFYTLDQNIGWPNYYEIRQCIEVFPAPMGPGYKLWIKGNFGLLPFTDDADVTTINPNPVFNWALGLAKAHKGDKDAGSMMRGAESGYFGAAIREIQSIVAGAHVNRRYIPGTAALPIPTPPVMVHFDS